MLHILNKIFPQNIANNILSFSSHPLADIIQDAFSDHDVLLHCITCSSNRYCFCLARYCSICSYPLCSNCYGKCFTYIVKHNTQLSFSICLACIFSNTNKDQLIEIFSESTKNHVIALLMH
jgi:hypothetical protein